MKVSSKPARRRLPRKKTHCDAHTVQIYYDRDTLLHGGHRARCACGWWSDCYAMLSDAERAVDVHLRRVAAPSHPTSGTPSTSTCEECDGQLSAAENPVSDHLRRMRLTSFNDLLARSSIGEALADVKRHGIEAHLADLDREPNPRGSRARRPRGKPPARRHPALRDVAELLTAAADDVATMLWYAERDAEGKGFQWLMAAAQRAADAQRRLKTFVDEQTDGWRMLDPPKFDTECPVHNTYHRNDAGCSDCAGKAP